MSAKASAKYQVQQPRAGTVQAKLVHKPLLGGKEVELVEWIPRDIKVGAQVQVDGDTRYWTVKEIYKQAAMMFEDFHDRLSAAIDLIRAAGWRGWSVTIDRKLDCVVIAGGDGKHCICENLSLRSLYGESDLSGLLLRVMRKLNRMLERAAKDA